MSGRVSHPLTSVGLNRKWNMIWHLSGEMTFFLTAEKTLYVFWKTFFRWTLLNNLTTTLGSVKMCQQQLLPETGVVLKWLTVAPSAALAKASPYWRWGRRERGDAPSQPTGGRAAEPFGPQSPQGPDSPPWVGVKMTVKRRLKMRGENGFKSC